jgi:AcrR family transcriptional regulator
MSHSTRSDRIQKRSAQRRQLQKEALRKEILKAASELFLEHGFEKFSLRQVAERIGYSPTTIYLYFKDKDELLFEVALEGFEQFGTALQGAYERSDDPKERIELLGRAYIDFGLKHPVHYQLMFMQRGNYLLRPKPGDRRPPIDSFGVLLKAVEEGMQAGVIPRDDPMTVSTLLWTGVHGIASLMITMPVFSEVLAWQVADRYFDMVTKGLMR